MLSQSIFKLLSSSFSSRSSCSAYKCLTMSCHISVCIYTYVCLHFSLQHRPYSALQQPTTSSIFSSPLAFQLNSLTECTFHLHPSASPSNHCRLWGFYYTESTSLRNRWILYNSWSIWSFWNCWNLGSTINCLLTLGKLFQQPVTQDPHPRNRGNNSTTW